MSEPDSPEDSTIRGVAVVSARDWVDAKLGTGTLHRLASESDSSWPIRILPGDRYPLGPLIQALEAATERVGGPEFEDVVAEIAAESAHKDLRTIHRAFLWAATPKLFLRAVPRVWSKYASVGSLANITNEDGCYQATLEGIPEELVTWVCGGVRGFLPTAIGLAGAKNINMVFTERALMADGKRWYVTFRLTYE